MTSKDSKKKKRHTTGNYRGRSADAARRERVIDKDVAVSVAGPTVQTKVGTRLRYIETQTCAKFQPRRPPA